MVLRGSGEDGKPKPGQDAALEENKQWQETAFPSYLQSAKDDFCQDWDEALQVNLPFTGFILAEASLA